MNADTRRLIGSVALWAALNVSVVAADFTFGALGDIPYSQDEEARFPNLIEEMNREELTFVVHVGDFKSAVAICTDELYLERRSWFESSRHPFIYVPGDNEWADCRRPPFTAGRDPFERLDKLRELFFADDTSLGRSRIKVLRQSPSAESRRYPEHSRWEHRGVLFLTLNAPGSNNYPQAREEFAARSAAVGRWLTESFATARARGLRAVVVFMHGDPWNSRGQPRRGFARIIKTLAMETRGFSGEVLLVNGDTHRYRVDRPLRDPATGAPLPNFLRVVVYGSPWMSWVRIRFREDGGRVSFEVTPGN
jgi:hypothetical protein